MDVERIEQYQVAGARQLTNPGEPVSDLDRRRTTHHGETIGEIGRTPWDQFERHNLGLFRKQRSGERYRPGYVLDVAGFRRCV